VFLENILGRDMYKDKEKQKQATKERVRRFRERVTPSTDVTPECNALPPEILASIEKTRLNRQELELEEDTQERLSRALCYQDWNRERLQNLINQPFRVPSSI
jgi:hypothetical protein